MQSALSWYDSIWLEDYFAARAKVRATRPDREADFVAAFDPLRTDPAFRAKIVRGFADAAFLAEVRDTIASLPKDRLEFHEARRFGRFVVHDEPVFVRMQAALVERMSELVGEEVEASYNFLSMYTRMGVCGMHLDAPSAKWTLDICIDQSEPWPIHFSRTVDWPERPEDLADDWEARLKADPALEFRSALLMPGDAVVFSGSSQWHYRDPIPQVATGAFCTLLFFHFIPEGAGHLVDPHRWAEFFDMPELATVHYRLKEGSPAA